MKWTIIAAFFLPIVGILLYMTFQFLKLAGMMGGSIASIAFGSTILLLAAFILFLLTIKNPIIRILLGLGSFIFFAAELLLFSISEFEIGHFGMMWASIELLFGILLFRDAAGDLKRHNPLYGIPKIRHKQLVSLLLAVNLLLSGALILTPLLPKTHSFAISDAQAQEYDLVLYWGGQTQMNETLVDICADANATLSFNMVESMFAAGDPVGDHCASVVAYANTQGVKIEIWPLFLREDGLYPSYSDTYKMELLYEKFHSWTLSHSITVDYLLWDIETDPNKPYEGWAKDIPLLSDLGNIIAPLLSVEERRNNWTETLQIWQELNQRAIGDGYTVRGTLMPLAFDLLDGDADFQLSQGLPGYEILEEYEYISQMIYRGCEWGGATTNEYVYQSVKAMSLALSPHHVAVCIGCINYLPYPDVESVTNDIYLALAAGAHSVRLFQGHSWVAGGTYPGHGYDGLEELLSAARSGGTGSYTRNYPYELSVLGQIYLDISLDLILFRLW